MKSERLQGCSKKVLLDLARRKGVTGWHAMRKEELVEALSRLSTTRTAKPQPQHYAARSTSGNGSTDQPVEQHQHNGGVPARNLAAQVPKNLSTGYGKDRIVVMVRDPYWLQCYWELTHRAMQRAEAALSQDWHTAKPILRLLDVSSRDITSVTESIVRDIPIHGGCNNWYIEVANPPRSYRIDIGYLGKRGQFYALARSNVVTTPRAGVSDRIDGNWSDIDCQQADHIYAMSAGFEPHGNSLELKQLFEERLRRPMGPPTVTGFGSGAYLHGKTRKFWFNLNAELLVYGSTEASARVTLQGEPIKLRPDGTFTMRFSLPDSRQIIPAVAASADGVEERTIVLAVERNTKELEPMIHDVNDD
jgi:hypothetical protein